MNCLSEERIQAFLDGELELMEHLETDVHLADCSCCHTAVEGKRKKVEALKLLLTEIKEPVITVPAFRGVETRKTKRSNPIQLYWLTGVAATILIFLLPGIFYTSQVEKTDYLQLEELMLSMEEEPFLSPNDLWHKKSVNFVISEGNVDFPQ